MPPGCSLRSYSCSLHSYGCRFCGEADPPSKSCPDQGPKKYKTSSNDADYRMLIDEAGAIASHSPTRVRLTFFHSGYWDNIAGLVDFSPIAGGGWGAAPKVIVTQARRLLPASQPASPPAS